MPGPRGRLPTWPRAGPWSPEGGRLWSLQEGPSGVCSARYFNFMSQWTAPRNRGTKPGPAPLEDSLRD